MEFLIILVVALFSGISLYLRTSSLTRRVEHIEQYLQRATAALGSAVGDDATHAAPRVTVAREDVPRAPLEHKTMTSPHAAAEPPAPIEPNTLERFIAWCRTDWLMKLGGFLVILGMGWFVSFAVAQAWIGELGRVTIGLCAGALVLIIGSRRMRTYTTQGSTLMVVGAATVILTLYAARELYDLFTPLIALLGMFGTAALLGLTALQYRRPSLAHANVLLAGIAPLLTNSPEPSLAGLMTYLLVLSLGAVWVAAVTGWRPVVLLSYALVFLYGLPYAVDINHFSDVADTGLLFAFGFAALYFFVSVVGMRVSKVKTADLAVALLSGGHLLVWILAAADPAWQSLLCAVWAIVFAGGAYRAVHAGAAIEFFYAYAGVGVALLGVATALELEGAVLTIAAFIEAALLLVVGYRITRRVESVPFLMSPSLIPILLSFQSMGAPEWRTGVLHEHAAVLLLALLTAFLVGSLFRNEGKSICTFTAHIAYTVTGCYAAVLAWLVPHALAATRDSGTFISLTLYTLAAAYLYMTGKQTGERWRRTAAGILITFVVGRLLLVEVAMLSLAGRVVTFIGIGTLFIIIAWLERSAVRERQAQPPQQ